MIVNILGDGLDALLLCHELLKKGHVVVIYGDESKLGGHFLGKRQCFDYLDSGMVLFEKEDRGVNQKPISEYQGEYAQSSRPFLLGVFEYLQDLYKDLVTHEIYVEKSNGGLVPDYFISDNVASLLTIFSESLGPSDQESLRTHLERLPESLHPQRKATDSFFRTTPLVEGLKLIYTTRFFEELFQTYLSKFSKTLDLPISTVDHRRLWTPLYHPETILSLLSTKRSHLEPIQFFRPKTSSIASMIAHLKSNLQEHKNFRIVPGHEFSMKKTKGERTINLLNLSRLSGLPFLRENLMGDLGVENINSSTEPSNAYLTISIIHFCISFSKPQTVFCLEKNSPVYRYSIYQDAHAGTVCSIEIAHNPENGTDLLEHAKEFCLERQIDIKCMGRINSSRIPLGLCQTAEMDKKNSEEEQRIENALTKFGILGQITPSPATSFNDNVLRMLYAREIVETW